MARFHGNIGFAQSLEVQPGVWKEIITERPYSGNILRKGYNLVDIPSVNDEIKTNNTVSVVADEFLMTNLHNVRYVNWMKSSWKITSTEVNYPRVTLYFGGIYHGKKN